MMRRPTTSWDSPHQLTELDWWLRIIWFFVRQQVGKASSPPTEDDAFWFVPLREYLRDTYSTPGSMEKYAASLYKEDQPMQGEYSHDTFDPLYPNPWQVAVASIVANRYVATKLKAQQPPT